MVPSSWTTCDSALAARIRLEGIFGNHRSEDTPLRRSLPRAQCDKRIEYHPVDLQARGECALARAKCPLGRNADVVDAGPPWRRLDALDQLRHLSLECVGWPKEVGPGRRQTDSRTHSRHPSQNRRAVPAPAS